MHQFLLFILLILAFSLVSGCAANPPAPAITPTVPPTNTPPPPAGAALWTFQTGAPIYSSPVVEAGTVYFGSDDGWLYAIEAASGAVKWMFETRGMVRSRPALADGMLYFTSDDGNLYAVEIGSGIEQWRADIGNDDPSRVLPVEKRWDYLQSSPAVVEGIVYVGSADGNLYAVDAQTGKEKWRFLTGERVRSSPAVA